MSRQILATIALAALGALVACSGVQEGSGSSRNADPESPFTRMPRGNEVPDLVFLDADESFTSGDYVAAQRQFGTLFIIDPGYRGGVPEQAITATCERLGVDCNLVFGRLEIMREVYRNRYGPVDSWVPAQRRDYFAILQCYEAALTNDFAGASMAGTPVIGSPDPYFADSARRCVETADAAIAAIERQRAADAAILVWFDNQPCMDQHRRMLLDAFDADDWEAFVEIYPQYQVCAQPLSDIIDAGVLVGDPRLGLEHDVAWSDMSEIDAIMEDYSYTYESTRDALVELEADPEYNRLVVQYENLTFEEGRLENQIASLQTARDALTGNNRVGVENQISALEAGLVAVRSQKREVLGDINRLRRDLGLTPRETP